MVLKQAGFRPKTEQSFGRRVKLHGSQTYLVWQIRSARFEEE
ncbi:hypothetical protein [Agathobaculum butyriciproducens]|nr:hypothetical protein [Agathobaculum butyriciproducens]